MFVSDVGKLQFLQTALNLNRDSLELSKQQLLLVKNLYLDKINVSLPTIFAITPTYKRYVQKAELTRISQTLTLVPNIYWIIVEDADEKSELVRNLLADSSILYVHLTAKTPPNEKVKDKVSVYFSYMKFVSKFDCRIPDGSSIEVSSKEIKGCAG